jgi:hypothetical protein
MTPNVDNASPDTPGVLLVLNDIVEAGEKDFNQWYQRQHLPERLGVPGFRTARRYRAVDGQPEYMAVYECESIDVLTSKAYLERLAHPTDWTRKIMPDFRNMLRSACRETWSVGAGVGGGAIVVQCKPSQGREDAARRFFKDSLAPGLMQSVFLARMSLWEADAAFTGGPSPEMALRGGSDKSADWVLFLESYDLGRTAPALDAQLSAGAAAETGLLIDSWTGYQLIYAATAPS